MFESQSLDLENCDQNTVIESSIKFLKLNVHKYGMYFYIPISSEESKRKVSDIVKLAYQFYNSTIDYDYLVTLSYDDIKFKANKIYKKRGYVLWRDLLPTSKFKQLVLDCTRENAIELILHYIT